MILNVIKNPIFLEMTVKIIFNNYLNELELVHLKVNISSDVHNYMPLFNMSQKVLWISHVGDH